MFIPTKYVIGLDEAIPENHYELFCSYCGTRFAIPNDVKIQPFIDNDEEVDYMCEACSAYGYANDLADEIRVKYPGYPALELVNPSESTWVNGCEKPSEVIDQAIGK